MSISAGNSARRRLAAVWFADIAGYTELTVRDENAAMSLVSAFQAAVRDAVARHGGNLVKFLGDGALAEFQSTEAAARAGMGLLERCTPTDSSETPLRIRIGLHLGEILVSSDGDVYGEGVNTASRLQSEAEPGQAVVSEDVWRQLRRLEGFRFEELGERRLKGIEEPVRVFALVAAPPAVPRREETALSAAGTMTGDDRGRERTWRNFGRRLQTRTRLSAVAALLALLAVAAWAVLRPGGGPSAGTPSSIAVIPLEVIGADPEDDYFAEGMTMELITRLARIEDLRVIGRNSSMRYKATDKTARRVGEELGAEAILAGTVQRSGERLRVGIQLIDARTEENLWAESYDRHVADVFAIQSDIASHVANALEATLGDGEGSTLDGRTTENIDAYAEHLRGRALLARHNEPDARAAVQAFESALELDPAYALAHAGLAMASAEMHLRFAPGGEAAGWGERAIQEARRALELDPNLAEAHEAMAVVYGKTDFDWERVIAESRRALELNPNLADPHFLIARAYYHLGLLEAAERQIRRGMEIDPVGDRADALRSLALVALFSGRYVEATTLFEESRELSEGRVIDLYLALAYFYGGEAKRAERLLRELGQSSSPSASARAKAALAGLLAARGERDHAETLLGDVVGAGFRDHHVAYGLGVAEAHLRRPENAVRWLREATDTGFPCYPWFERDPLLAPLHAEPEFVEFRDELRQRWEEARARYGE